MRIMLDAGHGYTTPGKRTPDGMSEYEFNRAVAQYTKGLLEDYQHVLVYFCHEDERDVPLQERTDKANRLKVDGYVSIHANAYGTGWNNAGGIETYIYKTRPKEAAELAHEIQHRMTSRTGLRDRGVKTADFHVLRETSMTAVLVECGFMTNQKEAGLLRADAFRRMCAEAIATAISYTYKLKKSAPSPADQQLFKVQAGAFKDKSKAEEVAARLKKAGYEAMVLQIKH
ncbi:N-acetylmuramoyl-L-alanine amidase [Mesobacillus harenae]|uniref:N-acetylmuramoyl-L-alanine amidase n=1 Tax=Mesobacillus harenae TaxID=2213203 RepID=UPI00158005FB|nr:N-acetylmuramoyl-L-alanine amidase [Mesobacillus harenae]